MIGRSATRIDLKPEDDLQEHEDLKERLLRLRQNKVDPN